MPYAQPVSETTLTGSEGGDHGGRATLSLYFCLMIPVSTRTGAMATRMGTCRGCKARAAIKPMWGPHGTCVSAKQPSNIPKAPLDAMPKSMIRIPVRQVKVASWALNKVAPIREVQPESSICLGVMLKSPRMMNSLGRYFTLAATSDSLVMFSPVYPRPSVRYTA